MPPTGGGGGVCVCVCGGAGGRGSQEATPFDRHRASKRFIRMVAAHLEDERGVEGADGEPEPAVERDLALEVLHRDLAAKGEHIKRTKTTSGLVMFGQSYWFRTPRAGAQHARQSGRNRRDRHSNGRVGRLKRRRTARGRLLSTNTDER